MTGKRPKQVTLEYTSRHVKPFSVPGVKLWTVIDVVKGHLTTSKANPRTFPRIKEKGTDIEKVKREKR